MPFDKIVKPPVGLTEFPIGKYGLRYSLVKIVSPIWLKLTKNILTVESLVLPISMNEWSSSNFKEFFHNPYCLKLFLVVFNISTLPLSPSFMKIVPELYGGKESAITPVK
ncbi:MAG: hypothetical protein MUC59_01985 [Saprospiraceae bacterium]|nr:hypothetical protein [Saprospiraceae bacterium]